MDSSASFFLDNLQIRTKLQNMKILFKTREEWLMQAVCLITPLFEAKSPAPTRKRRTKGEMNSPDEDDAPKYKVPKFRVSCGWPLSGGLSSKKRVTAQSWSPDSASDGVGQIFVSPFVNDVAEDEGVLANLVHEIVHQVVGHEAKHGPLFKACALAVGLDGKMTSTIPGPDLKEFISKWAEELGAYPNGKLDKEKGPTKTQTTRMIKAKCEECGYTVRLSRKWLDEVGAPWCPKHGEMKYELPPELAGEEEDEGGEDSE